MITKQLAKEMVAGAGSFKFSGCGRFVFGFGCPQVNGKGNMEAEKSR